ncbi:hypothetical protein HPB50_005746 [Hyalomma asiaticum]|uniref:Uncharacterized protein n=1 Tax=Hyalomma asiaticum TaxID=266040 RepID=A0ACB7SJW5_HYAAI|nr:hypothetical protein HPB50_005746 [Hyalomma asiaticum]
MPPLGRFRLGVEYRHGSRSEPAQDDRRRQNNNSGAGSHRLRRRGRWQRRRRRRLDQPKLADVSSLGGDQDARSSFSVRAASPPLKHDEGLRRRDVRRAVAAPVRSSVAGRQCRRAQQDRGPAHRVPGRRQRGQRRDDVDDEDGSQAG